MRAVICAFLAAMALAACTPVEQAVDHAAREGSKGIVIETLATRFPQVPKELISPFTDCIIDNASAVEIRDFARSALSGVDEQTVATVRTVLARPSTVACLQTRALGSGTL